MLFILFSLRVWQTISFSLKKKSLQCIEQLDFLITSWWSYLIIWYMMGWPRVWMWRLAQNEHNPGVPLEMSRDNSVVQDREVRKYHLGSHVSQWCLRNTFPLLDCFFFHFLQTVFTKHKMENLIIRHMNKEPLLIRQIQCWLLSIKLTCKPRALSYKY